MSPFFEFFRFDDPNVSVVTLGVMLLSASAAVVGCFTLVRKRALVGDAIAHAVLPGVCLAFMIGGTKNPLVLLIGAVISGWLSLLVMDFMVNKSKLKTDTAIGAVLSVFFGLGILLLTVIQNSGSGNQAGLDKFLFGKAASMTQDDVVVFGTVALILVVVVAVFYTRFRMVSFDPDYAKTLGLPVRTTEFVLATITVLAVATGIQAVGVVLMAALLITPAAIARFWTNSLFVMLLISAGMGAFAGLFGAAVSYTAPSMPTGPWIVMVLSFAAILSIFFAPGRGWLGRWLEQRTNNRKILIENLLKVFFKQKEQGQLQLSLNELTATREFLPEELQHGLQLLRKRKWITKVEPSRYSLTEQGNEESRRVVRLHRLWELYLNQRLNYTSDHVHASAEAMEHLLTPEMEAQLLEELGHPERDPHESEIPYGKSNTNSQSPFPKS